MSTFDLYNLYNFSTTYVFSSNNDYFSAIFLSKKKTFSEPTVHCTKNDFPTRVTSGPGKFYSRENYNYQITLQIVQSSQLQNKKRRKSPKSQPPTIARSKTFNYPLINHKSSTSKTQCTHLTFIIHIIFATTHTFSLSNGILLFTRAQNLHLRLSYRKFATDVP